MPTIGRTLGVRDGHMRKVICLLAGLALASCAQDGGGGPRDKARRAADAFLASTSPEGNELEWPATVEDAGATWLVIYHGPEGQTGGDGKVWVDKRTMKVVDVLLGQ